MKERRRHKRYAAPLFCSYETDKGKAPGIILDISLGGAQIEGCLTPTEGSLMTVTFLVSNGEPFSVGAQTVRCQEHTYRASKTFRFGLQFSPVGPEEHRKLGELVYQATQRNLEAECKT